MTAVSLNKTYDVIETGLLKTTASAVQMSDIPCRLIRFKAASDNSNTIYIGDSGVTVPSGTADATTGWPIDATDDTGWIPVENMNQFYIIGGTPNDSLYYMLVE